MQDVTQYVTIGVDHDIFAIPVQTVHEILDVQPLTRLPNAPSWLAGLIDVRGRSVPVVDLRERLGLSASVMTAFTRILVLDIDLPGHPGLQLGLLTDRVFEVTGLDEGQLEPPPDVGVRWRSDYIVGVGRRNGSFVIVFDLSRLLSGEDVPLASSDGLLPGRLAVSAGSS